MHGHVDDDGGDNGSGVVVDGDDDADGVDGDAAEKEQASSWSGK